MSLPGGVSLGAATDIVRPSVKVGKAPMGMPLRPDVERLLMRVVVDTHLHLPDMFELVFLDESGTTLDDAGLKIGAEVSISGGAANSSSAEVITTGEITAVEARCEDMFIYSIARGYDKSHRLQRGRKTRTYSAMTDADIARKIAGEAGLTVGTVDSTRTVHQHLAQLAQTDWEFLTGRAREIGYEVGVEAGEFYFRKPSSVKPGGGLGGALSSMASAAAGALGLGGSSKVTFKDNLISFHPRITAANLPSEVEVRIWDPKKAQVVSSKTSVATGTADIDGQDPAKLSNSFGGMGLPISVPSLPSIPGLPSLGMPASDKAAVMVNRPINGGSSMSTAADEAAAGLAEHASSAFAEAEGYAVGDPAIRAGKPVEVDGVPAAFKGKWMVTQAKHVFDDEDGGYHVRFWVSGREDRSLFSMSSGGPGRNGADSTIPGLVCAVITNNNDTEKLGRVKVALPWLSSTYESDWARVAHFGAGRVSGSLFTPEVGDEVLVGFEFGDPRRPYVLGGLINSNTKYELGGPAVKSTGLAGQVVKRGFISGAGNKLLFDDELAPPPATGVPPIKSAMTLGTAKDNMTLMIDQTAGTVSLKCDPKPPESQTPTGTLTIECGQAGTINIKTGAGGSVNIDGGANLSLKAQASLKLESQGTVEIKGTMVKIN